MAAMSVRLLPLHAGRRISAVKVLKVFFKIRIFKKLLGGLLAWLVIEIFFIVFPEAVGYTGVIPLLLVLIRAILRLAVQLTVIYFVVMLIWESVKWFAMWLIKMLKKLFD